MCRQQDKNSNDNGNAAKAHQIIFNYLNHVNLHAFKRCLRSSRSTRRMRNFSIKVRLSETQTRTPACRAKMSLSALLLLPSLPPSPAKCRKCNFKLATTTTTTTTSNTLLAAPTACVCLLYVNEVVRQLARRPCDSVCVCVCDWDLPSPGQADSLAAAWAQVTSMATVTVMPLHISANEIRSRSVCGGGFRNGKCQWRRMCQHEQTSMSVSLLCN